MIAVPLHAQKGNTKSYYFSLLPASLLTHIIETQHSFNIKNTKMIAKIYNNVRDLREGVAIVTAMPLTTEINTGN